ncbi:DUF5691 domain-containing protein [Undibacterium flavidum]|uniref:HEAT repeat protein n=1 Tax=Undibacterium flavidum TaxID=2762297 RepID=A0ABR6YD28_9BURK|nr:DUF5691 domain-containing protein [Undibacterium flavidum]MBC3874470.1 hypothetical protein [Undibacterium flavidum]
MLLPEKIHKAVLVGTSRSAIHPQQDELSSASELDSLLRDAAMPNLRLWQTIAANDLWLRAGYTPGLWSDASTEKMALVSASKNDEIEHCPLAAQELLHLILRDIHAELLAQWLQHAHARNATLPARFLVPLLNKADKDLSMQKLLKPLLGARGHWLVQQHPEWRTQYSLDSDKHESDEALTEQWHLASSQQREEILRILRVRNPQNARELLQQDWANESPENRATLLACLNIELSITDEDFLERALEDKRKEVRTVAQELLRRLPDSQLVQRCQERLSHIFSIEKSTGINAALGSFLAKLGANNVQASLQIKLPESVDKSMKRDGIGLQSYPGLGEKASWLRDLMRSTPAQHWVTTWQLTPSQILQLLSQHEFKDALLQGLLSSITEQATDTTADPTLADCYADWIALLIEHISKDKIHVDLNLIHALVRRLRNLAPAMQDKLLIACMDNYSRQDLHILYAWSQLQSAASEHATPVSQVLSQAWLQHVQRQIAQSKQTAWDLRQHLKQIAYWLDVSDLSYTTQSWPADDWEHWSFWREAVHEFRDTFQFRHQLKHSFMETSI